MPIGLHTTFETRGSFDRLCAKRRYHLRIHFEKGPQIFSQPGLDKLELKGPVVYRPVNLLHFWLETALQIQVSNFNSTLLIFDGKMSFKAAWYSQGTHFEVDLTDDVSHFVLIDNKHQIVIESLNFHVKSLAPYGPFPLHSRHV